MTFLHDRGSLSDVPALTDEFGRAQSTLTLGRGAGTTTVTVSVGSPPVSVTFTATAVLPPPKLPPREMRLLIISGHDQTGVIGETLPNPFAVRVRDPDNIPLEGVTVTFAVTAGGGTLSTTTTVTDTKGRAESTLTLGSEPGTNTVEVRAQGISQTRIFRAEATLPPPVPTRLLNISGDNQTGFTGEALANPFVTEVRDQRGDPMEEATVTFTVLAGGGTLSAATVMTDANGRAESTLTLGSEPGTNTVEVRVEGVAETVVFRAEGTLPPPTPTVLSIVSGENQEGLTGEPLANPFIVEVHDQYGDPMEGATVTFTVLAGGGTLSAETVMTDANGQAGSTLTLGTEPGTNTIEASVEGVSQTETFNAEATLPPPIPSTLSIGSDDSQTGLIGETLADPFVVEVDDQYGDPIEGVMVTFTFLSGDDVLNVETTMSDANGRAETTLTLGTEPGGYTVEVSVAGIAETVTFNLIAELLQFDLSLQADLNLIHVPLKVRTVDGVTMPIESVSDLYDALGGADVVNYLITHDAQTQAWHGYFGDADRGSIADRILTDQMGVLADIKTPFSIRLGGGALGTDGMGALILSQGLNLVGLPLDDPSITRVSDLFALEGIGGNIAIIVVTDNGEFKAVGRADDPGDIEITGGQSFILIVQQPAAVPIIGNGWDNVP